MSKFLIVGDIHFRISSPISRKDDIRMAFVDKFKQIKDLVSQHNIDFIVCVGDVFDRARTTNEALWLAQECISSVGVDFFTIVGNHDMIGNSISNHKLSSLHLLDAICDNLHIINEYNSLDYEDVVIRGNTYGNDEFMLTTQVDDKRHIIVSHSMIVDSFTMFESINVSDIVTNADLIINGHNHNKLNKNKVYNPGALVRLTADKCDMTREVEVGIWEDGVITPILLNITPYTEIFDTEHLAKKEKIIDKSLMEQINKLINTSSNVKDIISSIAVTEGYSSDLMAIVEDYLERGRQ